MTTRHKWTESDGRLVVADLDADGVAALSAGGIGIHVCRRYLCERPGERHVGEYTAEEIAAQFDGWEVRPLADGEDVPPPPVEPPEPGPFHISKLALVEMLIAAGMLDAFLAALDSAPPARVLFDAAQDLASDHPLFVAFLPGVAQVLEKTETEAMQILREAAQ